jgi:hypothetical protein
MSADVWVFTDIGDGVEHQWASLNVTYNLSEMLAEAGFGRWRERESDSAQSFGERIRLLINELESRPDHYARFDSPNGWGTLADLLPALREFHAAVPWHRTDLQLGWWL